MSRKTEPGQRNRIPYLLRQAFKEAREGDRDAAMAWWNMAISEGYEAKVKTKKQLMYELRVAMTPEAAIETGKEVGIKVDLPETESGQWTDNRTSGLAAKLAERKRSAR